MLHVTANVADLCLLITHYIAMKTFNGAAENYLNLGADRRTGQSLEQMIGGQCAAAVQPHKCWLKECPDACTALERTAYLHNTTLQYVPCTRALLQAQAAVDVEAAVGAEHGRLVAVLLRARHLQALPQQRAQQAAHGKRVRLPHTCA